MIPFVFILAGCSAVHKKPLVDPFPLNFPLVDAGTIDIEGTVVGQPRARDGIVYYATREGYITAVVVPSRQVFWRFKADNPVSAAPELGEGCVLIRDDGNVLCVLDLRGGLVLKKKLDEAVTSAAREFRGRAEFGTASGKVLMLNLPAGGEQLWEYMAAAPAAAVTAGPVFAGNVILFGSADGRLLALDQAGKLVWEFVVKVAIAVDPAVAEGRLYFGTEDRFFYCLNAATGKLKWRRKLQGAPVGKILVKGNRVVVAASNSVVYTLSAKGGSILSWEAVPSRVIHEMTMAGPLVLVTSASQTLAAFDPSTGKRAGQYETSGTLAAGALWVPPFVVLFEESAEPGRQRIVFLRSR